MKIILDTNIWSSIGDEGVVHEFNDLMRSCSLQVLMPPSTLVEVVRIPAAEVRQRIVHALVKGSKNRLPTEAESESNEVVDTIRKFRPQWMRRMPDTAKVASLNGFWTKRIWRAALEDSTPLYNYQLRHPGAQDYMVSQQKAQRKTLLRDQFQVRPLTALLATALPEAPESYIAGWSGSAVEPWRIESRDISWHELVDVAGPAMVTKEDATVADWVGAYVDLSQLRSDRADFTRLWVEDAQIEFMRRQWTRWAVRTMQTDRKVTNGNPADEQHSSYLVDCDLFLSADASYIAVLNAVREDAPFPFVEARLVSGDRTVPVLERIAAVL
ncbi:hypothetical protein ACFFQW_46305 [Umezawaea endophytica]|uniref:Uncharacterized protein n=1 Tax=Umezawaea endophytica TaxID=1654476 RepID=A0A9X3AIK9_9PSEU|nr:hypothetical protein [Umezawaea endophytica]MCS7482686.1 hypothetical protein [Umezawaea endophytica]